MKFFEIAVSAILGGTIGVATTYLVLDGRLSAMQSQLDQMTPIASIDFLSIAQNAPPEGLTDSEMKSKLSAMRAQADRLADEGFVVLRHEKIYSAPDGLVIRDGVEE